MSYHNLKKNTDELFKIKKPKIPTSTGSTFGHRDNQIERRSSALSLSHAKRIAVNCLGGIYDK